MSADPAPVAAAAPDGPSGALPPRRPPLRRILLRPSVVVCLLAAIVIAGNVWMYRTIDRWSAEASGLQESARTAGTAIGQADATIRYQTDFAKLLEDQTAAAAALSEELRVEAEAHTEHSGAYKEAALGFERCADERAQAIAALWVGGSSSALVEAANADCAAAQAQLDSLAAGS